MHKSMAVLGMERGPKNHAKICHASCIQMETSSSPITYEPKHPRRKSREALLPRALVSLHYKFSLKKYVQNQYFQALFST